MINVSCIPEKLMSYGSYTVKSAHKDNTAESKLPVLEKVEHTLYTSICNKSYINEKEDHNFFKQINNFCLQQWTYQ